MRVKYVNIRVLAHSLVWEQKIIIMHTYIIYIPVLIDIHYPLCFLLKVNFSLLIVFAAWNSNFFLFCFTIAPQSILCIIIHIFHPLYVQFIKFLNHVEKLNYSTYGKILFEKLIEIFFSSGGKNEKNKKISNAKQLFLP